MDPRTKRTVRKAEACAVRTLADAYRLLVDIIEDYNNRPHTSLRRRRILTQAGVAPTPRDAYLWGLKNITGLRSAPLTEDDYHRLLLSTDKASIARGVLRYKNRPYLPGNEPAAELARRSTSRAKSVGVKLDKTMPTEVWVPSDQGTWACFVMTEGTAKEIAGMSLDEEEALASRTSLLWARAEHEGRIARLTAKNEKRTPTRKGRSKAVTLPKAGQTAVRAHETARMKEALIGKPRAPRQEQPQTDDPTATADWARLEEEERLRNLALIRQHRSKR